MDKAEGCHKVAWSHLILPKTQGGLGLVDPQLKAVALQGQWILKAVSPSAFPWKGYILGRLQGLRAVKHGGTSVAHLLAAKPFLKEWMGSPIWRAIWQGWERLRSLLKFLPPTNRDVQQRQ